MIVSDLRSTSEGGVAELSARVAFAAEPGVGHRVRFRCDAAFGPLPACGDPFLVGLVLSCMMLGEDLRIDGPVTPELVEVVRARTVPLVRRWRPGFGEPAIETAGAWDPPAEPAPGVAVCFSSGLDSLYSLEKHRARVTHLLSLRGYDRNVDPEPLWRGLCARGREVCDELGTSFVAVESDLREVARNETLRLGRRAGRAVARFYSEVHHGSFLVAVARCLPHLLGELVIGASFVEDALIPWGSHPELDASWTTASLRVVHDGCEADRIEKARRLVAWNPDRVRILTVCHDRGRPDPAGCGRCGKCTMTLMALRLHGASHLAESFAAPLDLDHAAGMRIRKTDRSRFERLRRAAAAAGDRELVSALDAALGAPPGWRRRLDGLRRRLVPRRSA